MNETRSLAPFLQPVSLSRRLLVKAAAALGTTGAIALFANRSALADDTSTTEKNMEMNMMLATTTVADVNQFLKIFSTTSLVKRQEHGSKGATVFRDPNQADRVWVIFDWDVAGFKSFATDPTVGPILKEAGHTSKPQIAEFANHYSA